MASRTLGPLVERWIGGAGTGKTTLLIRKLSEWKDRLNLPPECIGLCTFTRNGRREMSERIAKAWGVEPELLTKSGFFRTAHSICYRQLGAKHGQLIHGAAGNKWLCELFPGQVQPQTGEETSYGDQTPTARALAAWDLSRNRVVPLYRVVNESHRAGGQCPPMSEVVQIVTKYETAKIRDGKIDFTDLVGRFSGVKFSWEDEHRLGQKPEGEVPEGLRVLAVDEAQDSSKLVDLVCRRLAASPAMEAVFLCGDPYQSIFSFTGSDYRHFKSWEADEYIMPESYRCPPQIMAVGENCIRRMRSGYVDRGIMPAKHGGTVVRAYSTSHAIDMIPPEGSVMIVGRCGFSVTPYIGWLNTLEIPSRSLEAGMSSTITGLACLWKLQEGVGVSADEWEKAIAMTVVNHKEHGALLRRGEKAAWAAGKRGEVDCVLPIDEELKAVGCTDALVSLIRQKRAFDAIDATHKDAAEVFRKVATKRGLAEAVDPRVKLSTIHAAKGAEADTVIVSTISSPAVERARMMLEESHDEECRVAYVAVTRARKKLIVVDDAGDYAMHIPTGGL